MILVLEIGAAGDFSSSAALGVVGNVNVPAFGINVQINEGAFLNSSGGSLGEKYLGYSLSGASGNNYGWIRRVLQILLHQLRLWHTLLTL